MKRAKRQSRQPQAGNSYGWYALVALLALVLNANTLSNGFTLDDRTLVLEDARVRDLGRLPELLLGGYRPGHENSLYRPLTSLTIALNYAVAGPSAWAFHLVNLLLHLAACLLIFRLGTLVLGDRPAGLAAALLFAAHPVHVEAVANVVGRAEIMTAALVAAALIVLWREEASGPGLSVRGGVVAASLYLLGLFSKESAVTGVGLWVVLLWFSEPGAAGGRVRAIARSQGLRILLAVTCVYIAVRYAVLGTIAPAVQPEITFVENPLAFIDGRTRILTSITVLPRYLRLLVWPMTLSSDYSYNSIPLIRSLLDPRLILSAAVLLGLAVAALLHRKKRPVYLIALLFFLVSISVVSNLVVPIGATMAERFLYLPSAAFCWAVAQLGRDLGAWRADVPLGGLVRSPGLAVIGLCLLPLGIRTVIRNRDWQGDGVLFESAAAVEPDNAKAKVLLADYHFGQGDFRGAEEGYRRALAIYPDYAGAAINLAAALDAQGRYDESLKLLDGFAGRSGKFEPARLREIGRAQMGLGAWPQAASAYERALALFEPDPLAHRNLGGILIQYLGNTDEGRIHIRRSLEIAPDQEGADRMREALR